MHEAGFCQLFEEFVSLDIFSMCSINFTKVNSFKKLLKVFDKDLNDGDGRRYARENLAQLKKKTVGFFGMWKTTVRSLKMVAIWNWREIEILSTYFHFTLVVVQADVIYCSLEK